MILWWMVFGYGLVSILRDAYLVTVLLRKDGTREALEYDRLIRNRAPGEMVETWLTPSQIARQARRRK